MEDRRIVVGADGTPSSADALLWAAGEAQRAGARLVVLHAWDAPGEQAPYAPPAWHDDAPYRHARAIAVLDQAVKLIRDARPGLRVEQRLVAGRPEVALARAARRAALLVLGSAAHHAGDGRLGVVVLSCLRWPPCPVTVVPSRPVLPPPVGSTSDARQLEYAATGDLEAP
ncbi:universal stress protein [Nonomuraea indica]|uniref:universal stress protein n=1 Tax=Nonomuraea indica TaxID=1581193 RepID=UPI000C7B3934|nr:universal stress protein [Nonomuraea indica]